MTEENNGIEFDPGFGPHILEFNGSISYLYKDINRFKNFSQRKTKFMQYYKKILMILNNNIGFFVGCLMWANYIKTLPEQKILNNHCFGSSFKKEEYKEITQNYISFIESFPNDMKYYLTQEFNFDENIKQILEIYEEFCVLNNGFSETKINTEIVLPPKIKVGNSTKHKEIIDEAIKQKDLSYFIQFINLVI